MSTYIQLVNGAILESGVDLDDITSGEFASPTQKMHVRFKTWVRDAWRDLQIERQHWQFGVGRSIVTIKPRIFITDGDRATAPPATSEYQGQDSEASFIITGSELVSGAWADGDAVAYLDVEALDPEGFAFDELYDELAPTPAAGVFRIAGLGTYKLTDEAQRVYEPLTKTFLIQDPTAPGSVEALEYKPWEEFFQTFGGNTTDVGKPRYISEDHQGRWAVWPHPDKAYTVLFDYAKGPQLLSAETDTPDDLPTQYHDVIKWSAVMRYADYDNNPRVFNTGKKHFQFFKNLLENTQLPEVTLRGSKFNE